MYLPLYLKKRFDSLVNNGLGIDRTVFKQHEQRQQSYTSKIVEISMEIVIIVIIYEKTEILKIVNILKKGKKKRRKIKAIFKNK